MEETTPTATPPPHRRIPLRTALRPLLTTTALVLAYYLLPLDNRLTSRTLAGLLAGLAALVFLFTLQIRSITRSPRPRLRAVEALATTLPLFLLLYATTYYLLEDSEPESFTEPLTRTDALYFTLTVFSTVGFGDITPRTETARAITMTQMTGNLLLVGVAARLVLGAVQTALRHHPPSNQPPRR